MTRYCLIPATLCILCAGGAVAETTWNQPGKGTGVTKASTVEIAEGHSLMQISSTYDTVEMQDASHPMHGAAGPCFGSVEISGTAVSGSGVCAFTDSGGDKVVLHWTADAMEASGAMAGNWTLTGGTGKWAEAEGGGTYSSLADPASGTFVNTITSKLTLP